MQFSPEPGKLQPSVCQECGPLPEVPISLDPEAESVAEYQEAGSQASTVHTFMLE